VPAGGFETACGRELELAGVCSVAQPAPRDLARWVPRSCALSCVGGWSNPVRWNRTPGSDAPRGARCHAFRSRPTSAPRSLRQTSRVRKKARGDNYGPRQGSTPFGEREHTPEYEALGVAEIELGTATVHRRKSNLRHDGDLVEGADQPRAIVPPSSPAPWQVAVARLVARL
jgi:hypothetical protein